MEEREEGGGEREEDRGEREEGGGRERVEEKVKCAQRQKSLTLVHLHVLYDATSFLTTTSKC